METQDTLHTAKLMSLFPTEIWLTILIHVDNYTDYIHICDSSTFLKSALQTFRTTVLLPDVIHVLYKWLKSQYKVYKWKAVNVLLPIRLVCSSGRNGVDKILLHLDDPFLGVYPYIRKANQLDKYKGHLSCNPFLTRAVSLEFRSYEGYLSSHYPELLQMLENFGHHIWYCRIFAYPENTQEHITFYDGLPTILELMPNLHGLEFYQHMPSDAELGLSEDHFPLLRRLTAVHDERSPPLVMQRLLKRNPQIVRVCNTQFVTPEHVSLYLTEMPHLQDLCIALWEDDAFNQFRDCREVACRLTKLDIRIRRNVQTSRESVFSLVESHFGNTLQYLSIEQLNSRVYTDGCSLNLPNLKTLELYWCYPNNLDFILITKQTLENLIINCQSYEKSQQKNEGLVNVYKCRENLHNSNIWELFGKLKCLKVCLSHGREYECSRSRWKQQSVYSQNHGNLSPGK